MQRIPIALLIRLLALTALSLPSESRLAAENVAQPDIAEAGYVAIGGIEQWITIRGEDRHNPAILFLHGGPGNPISASADSVYGAWMQQFTLVQWDQRSSGKTYQRNKPSSELELDPFHESKLSIDLLVQDAIEVSEYARQRLGKEKLILTGTSWGSVLGIHLAKERPDLFYAFVGVSQFVNYEQNLAASYHLVEDFAREKADEAALAQLEALGPPPWKNPRNFGKLRRIIRRYEMSVTSPYPDFKWAPEYDNDEYRAAYLAGEELSFLKFVGLENDGMASTVDLPALGTDFEIPVYFVQGEEDLLTAPEVTQAYYDQIVAPDKDLILVPAAGHDPNFAAIEAHYKTIVDKVLPLIE